VIDLGRWFVHVFQGRAWFDQPDLVGFACEVITRREGNEWIEIEIVRMDGV
jgi:hypothetical protein